MQESVNLLPTYFRHQPKKGDDTKFYKQRQQKKPSEKRDPTNPFAVHLVNPFVVLSFGVMVST